MKLTTHLYLVPRLRMDGTKQPKSTFLQGMHRDDFIFLKYNHIEGLLNILHMGHVLNTVSGRKV